jgi:hypothetical protein
MDEKYLLPKSIVSHQVVVAHPLADRLVGPISTKAALIFTLKNYPAEAHFKSLHGFLIRWFVACHGVEDFKGADGPGRVVFTKSLNRLTIANVISEPRWRNRTIGELRETISAGDRQCFELLISRARKMGELKDEAALIRTYNEAMQRFDNEPDPAYIEPWSRNRPNPTP